MIVEAYRCMIDEEFVKFKEFLHKATYNASIDEDINDVDMQLLRMHLVDLQEDLDDIISE